MKTEESIKGGYYTVNVEADAGIRIPCTIFATSNEHAAGLVWIETGYLAKAEDVQGPYTRV